MILPDVNTLLFSVNTATDQHRAALEALEDGYAAPRGVAFAWIALLAFLRLSTRSGIFPKPLSVEDALRVIEHWLKHPNAQVVHLGERHSEVLGRLLLAAGTAGNLTTDAHLAALAIEHDATIVSFDRDFARFADVQWTLPVKTD
ncbi:MAG: type II toxin-antitoxin system VapC family toxin [Steroidobacteraceae bacterium]